MRPGYAIKSNVNGRNPRPATPVVLLEPIRDAPRGTLLRFSSGPGHDGKEHRGATLSVANPPRTKISWGNRRELFATVALYHNVAFAWCHYSIHNVAITRYFDVSCQASLNFTESPCRIIFSNM